MTTILDTMSAQDIIKALTELKESAGWKLLTEIIRRNDLKKWREGLLGGEYKTLEERNRDRDRYDLVEFFVDNSIDTAISGLSGDQLGTPVDQDVFPRTAKEAADASMYKNESSG